jgi:hypothetical protein
VIQKLLSLPGLHTQIPPSRNTFSHSWEWAGRIFEKQGPDEPQGSGVPAEHELGVVMPGQDLLTVQTFVGPDREMWRRVRVTMIMISFGLNLSRI